uniref:Apyrase n=1 Tax=Opuntia streptacantha TaxID=393608 RepID=A0A7C9APC4_OPUST
MIFDKIAEIIYSATKHSSMRHSSSIPYMAAGLSPPKGSGNGFSFGSPGQMNNLRLSSSLQDLSQYRRVDPEGGDLNGGNDPLHSKPPLPSRRDISSPSFSKDKVPLNTPFFRKKWTKVLMSFLCLVMFGFFAFLLGQFLYSLWSGGASNYYVVLDCGSTGTRVYIYEASVTHMKNSNLPIVLKSYSGGYRKPKGQSGRAYNRMETEPGLDKLVRNSTGLKSAIKPLLRWAEKQIPKSSHKTTSLFLYATGGVRRLPAPDSEWLLNHVWSVLKSSPFVCQREWVKTISGMEEAYYGWIALNYEIKVLGSIPKKATFGALDLGGSSLQVTFESKEPVHDKTNLNLSIGPVSHHLSAYSLSGYGLNDAFDKSVVHLLKGMPKVSKEDLAHGNLEIRHPCLHSGYKSQYTCSQCASINEVAETPHYGKKGVKKGGKPGVPVWLVGSPNWAECRALAKIAVNLSEWSDLSPGIDCDVHPCALSEDLPHPYGHFYAMSGFFVVYRFFNLTSEATLDDVLEKGQQFCVKTWEVAYKSVPPQPFIEQYCFRAPYIVMLLREGLHITESQITIGSGGTTWTQGVALVEAGKAFAAKKEHRTFELFQVKIDPVILFAILLISSFLLVCALSCVGNWLPRYFRRSYLPVFRHNGGTSTVLSIPSPFRFQRWSPISSGDSRVKMPLSPTTANDQERPFSPGPWLGTGNIQLTDSPFYPAASSVAHSFSSGSLGQLQFDNNGMGSGWSPLRSQMGLQSRRSQSREDLISSLADAHIVKV